jgi:hypothetical protein
VSLVRLLTKLALAAAQICSMVTSVVGSSKVLEKVCQIFSQAAAEGRQCCWQLTKVLASAPRVFLSLPGKDSLVPPGRIFSLVTAVS